MLEVHPEGSTTALAFRACGAVLEGLDLDDCMDVAANLLASVVIAAVRFRGGTLEQALDLSEAAIGDVGDNIRLNW